MFQENAFCVTKAIPITKLYEQAVEKFVMSVFFFPEFDFGVKQSGSMAS